MGSKFIFKREAAFFLFFSFLMGSIALAETEEKCPGLSDPPPVVLKADLKKVENLLRTLKDAEGRSVWKDDVEWTESLLEIFEATPQKTKLEQFFQLLFLIQKQIDRSLIPITIKPPRITEILLAAKVFTKPDFPQKIRSVTLDRGKGGRSLTYTVDFAGKEVRFPLNNGQGFSSWDQGMCQTAKELVFYPGFSFRLRPSTRNKNLVVEGFEKVEIYGTFGSRKIFDIDLNYVDLEKVEFVRGTDEGYVTAKVAKREFKENKHSKLFKYVGSLIPNTARQRIDW